MKISVCENSLVRKLAVPFRSRGKSSPHAKRRPAPETYPMMAGTKIYSCREVRRSSEKSLFMPRGVTAAKKPDESRPPTPPMTPSKDASGESSQQFHYRFDHFLEIIFPNPSTYNLDPILHL